MLASARDKITQAIARNRAILARLNCLCPKGLFNMAGFRLGNKELSALAQRFRLAGVLANQTIVLVVIIVECLHVKVNMTFINIPLLYLSELSKPGVRVRFV